MKALKAATLATVAAFCLVGPSLASAADESLSATLNVTPAGTLYKDAKRPINWEVETLVSAPPTSTKINPLKVATISNPSELTFNPDPNMPNCPDDQIGPPPVNVSIPVPTAVARCPESVIGNGSALFQLGAFNTPAQQRFGYEVIFKGAPLTTGPLAGRPRIKIYAYSYGTNAGIYTEASLSKTGELVFSVPRLTADSAVTSLNLEIPGQPIEVTDPAAPNPKPTVPAGETPGYSRANCPGTEWALSATFELGIRDNAGNPDGPSSFVSASDTEPCVGEAGSASLSSVKIAGPSSVKVGKSATFKVTVANSGTANATGSRLAISGKGLSVNASLGTIPAEGSKTVSVKAKFKSKGKVKGTFKATSTNGGRKSATKTVIVK